MNRINFIKLAADLIVLEESVPLARRYLSIRRRERILDRAKPEERLRLRYNRIEILKRFLEAELVAVLLKRN